MARRGLFGWLCGSLGRLFLFFVFMYVLVFSVSALSPKKPPRPELEMAKEREEQEARTGDVSNSPWDGSVYQVQRFLKQNLNDAGSVQYLEWSPVRETPNGYVVRCKYRAKNGFGAYMMENQLFYLDKSGHVTNVMDWK